MKLYTAADLHSNNHFLSIIDEQDKRIFEKRLPNDLSVTLKVLEPYRVDIVGIAVESTFNWYWLVDGLMEAGYPVILVNTSKVKQYEGLRHTDDKHDAFWFAHLMRLGILPAGYIYPKEQRAVRDLLRERRRLVQQRATHVLSTQSTVWRHGELGNPSFLLQDHYVKEFAENLQMHLLVKDVDAWWAQIQARQISQKYAVQIGSPEDRDWKMRDFFLFDPSGVLWRVAQDID